VEVGIETEALTKWFSPCSSANALINCKAFSFSSHKITNHKNAYDTALHYNGDPTGISICFGEYNTTL